MEDELGRDVIDGDIIDWSKMSVEDLEKMKSKLKTKEKGLLEKINKELEEE